MTRPDAAGTGHGNTVIQFYRPCRYCGADRPLVPIGSSRWWDCCAKCARGISNVQRRYILPELAVCISPDPWAERVLEVLEQAEERAA